MADVDRLDWAYLAAELDAHGGALTTRLLGAAQCRALAEL